MQCSRGYPSTQRRDEDDDDGGDDESERISILFDSYRTYHPSVHPSPNSLRCFTHVVS